MYIQFLMNAIFQEKIVHLKLYEKYIAIKIYIFFSTTLNISTNIDVSNNNIMSFTIKVKRTGNLCSFFILCFVKCLLFKCYAGFFSGLFVA